MYCARSSSSQSYEGVYLYKVYYYRKVHIGTLCRMAMETEIRVDIGMLIKEMYSYEWSDGEVWWHANQPKESYEIMKASNPVRNVKRIIWE